MTTAIEAAGLQKQFRDGRQALNGIDLSIEAGESVALVGANGAGKSTLLRCLIRLQEPTAGTISIGAEEVTGASRSRLRSIRQDVGFVFQHFNLVERASAFRNVTNGAIARRGSRCAAPLLVPRDVREEAMDCLDRVGLAHIAQHRVDALSGGQRQRVAIARSLMQRPTVILADEPVASLDPEAGRSVMELLQEVTAERGITVVAALHQMEFALSYTQRIVGLRSGKVELDEPTAGLSVAELAGFFRDQPQLPGEEQQRRQDQDMDRNQGAAQNMEVAS